MKNMDNNAHSVFSLSYHLIMVTKYRKNVYDYVLKHCLNILLRV